MKIERCIQHIYASQLKSVKEILNTSYDELFKQDNNYRFADEYKTKPALRITQHSTGFLYFFIKLLRINVSTLPKIFAERKQCERSRQQTAIYLQPRIFHLRNQQLHCHPSLQCPPASFRQSCPQYPTGLPVSADVRRKPGQIRFWQTVL